MIRFVWKKVDVQHGNYQFWVFQQTGEPGILSWIIKRDRLYCRYGVYPKSRGSTINLLTDGKLEGVFASLEGAQRSIVYSSRAEVPELN